jgi:hypothetical protein
MVTHARTPDMAHQALVTEVHSVVDRHAGMPVLERVAMLAQVIGHLIAEVPDRAYGAGEIMQAVALNIASGNQQTARSIAAAIEGAKGN